MLSEAALEASLQQALAQRPAGPDVWLFGYGSLVWNPFIRFLERRPGTVRGYHRRFCLWSRINRGTPEQPGLALGLEPGGACRGVVFRMDDDVAEDELRILWRREMMLGSYVPRWVRATSRGDTPDRSHLRHQSRFLRLCRQAGRCTDRRHPDARPRPLRQQHGLSDCIPWMGSTTAASATRAWNACAIWRWSAWPRPSRRP
ncbi:MAG: gamma-glutamylcyclotransferase [Comamonadaceae bacterium]|nr:gamma-glutamylcyclotransferase [Comamonadaceae bacterium]